FMAPDLLLSPAQYLSMHGRLSRPSCRGASGGRDSVPVAVPRPRLGQEEPQLEAVGEAPLAENGWQVGFYGPLADHEARGDIAVAGPRSDERGDLPLPGGQQGKAPVGPDGGLGGVLVVYRALLDQDRDQPPLGPDLAFPDPLHRPAKQRPADFP